MTAFPAYINDETMESPVLGSTNDVKRRGKETTRKKRNNRRMGVDGTEDRQALTGDENLTRERNCISKAVASLRMLLKGTVRDILLIFLYVLFVLS